MTNTKAETYHQPQRPTEVMISSKNTFDGSIWTLYVGMHSFGGRIKAEAELDS